MHRRMHSILSCADKEKNKKKKPWNIHWTWNLNMLQSQCSLLEMTTLTKKPCRKYWYLGLCFCGIGGGHITAAGFYEKRKDRNIWQPSGWVPSVSSADTFAHWCSLKLTAAFLNAPFIKRSPTTQADGIKSATEVELGDVLSSLWSRFCNNDCVFSDSVPGSEVFLTVSSSRSLTSPLRLLWMKALALLDLDILILASLAFWEWEEKGQRIKQGGFERRWLMPCLLGRT